MPNMPVAGGDALVGREVLVSEFCPRRQGIEREAPGVRVEELLQRRRLSVGPNRNCPRRSRRADAAAEAEIRQRERRAPTL